MFEKVTAILREYTNNENTPMSMESTLVDDLGLSSLEVINIVLAFEDEFGIEFTPSPEINTVGKLVEAVEKLVEG